MHPDSTCIKSVKIVYVVFEMVIQVEYSIFEMCTTGSISDFGVFP
jgi:hypothetical protein